MKRETGHYWICINPTANNWVVAYYRSDAAKWLYNGNWIKEEETDGKIYKINENRIWPPPEMSKYKEITGFETHQEHEAYDKGRLHEAKTTEKFILNWNGSTNSVFGQMLYDKFIKNENR